MAEAQPEVGAVTLILIGVFGLSVWYAAVGNFILFVIMKNKGSKVPVSLGGLAVLAYFRESRQIRSKALDRFALSVILSVPVALAAALLLFPRIWA